ncbi:MADS-box protein SOC1-like [Coffea eugenioides]|uniref:MADS-box protein SOC1-like n=1 Tax=Coffea eugenioides TaxID=49369 RepID=UPI000F60E2D4|nr:MADS-box protein SOC1-like [Coffea eugenioides]
MEENAVILNKRKFGGRRKIQIKKIEKKKNLLVSFSKRRAGLFKKAEEYTKKSGAQVAILVQSPGGRFFTFGGPDSASVDSILEQYLAGMMPSSSSSSSAKNGTVVDDQGKSNPVEIEENTMEEEVIEQGLMETNQVSDGKESLLKQLLDNDDLQCFDELENYMVTMKGLESEELSQEDDGTNRAADDTINGDPDSSSLLNPNVNLDYFGGFPVNNDQMIGGAHTAVNDANPVYFSGLPVTNDFFQEYNEMTRAAADAASSSLLIPKVNLDYFSGLPKNNDFFQDDEMARPADTINGDADPSSLVIPNVNLDYFGGLPMNNDFFQDDEMNRAADAVNGDVDSSSLLIPSVNLDCFGGLPVDFDFDEPSPQYNDWE